MSGPILRHGRRVPIHLYEQHGAEPSDRDEPVGSVWDEQWARRIVEAMAAEPGEVVRLREMVEHYRRRGEMTPSERQSILGEDYDDAVEPERSGVRRARERFVDGFTDSSGMAWAMETSQRLGIEIQAGWSLVQALAVQVVERGRPMPEGRRVPPA